ncbi:hypothetical protein Tco_0972443 [Tanacetum coccineum]
MSTQQDIYAAGSEKRPPMLNKENYVPWSSRLLRRMIPEPGDADREVPVPETFHEQTDDELTEAEIKQMEADDSRYSDFLLGIHEDIYAAIDKFVKLLKKYGYCSTNDERSHNAMNMALVLMAKAFKLNYSTPTNNNQRISSNPRNRQIAQPGMNMGQDRQMQMVGANGWVNQLFRQAVSESGGQIVGNQNRLIGVSRNDFTKQNPYGNWRRVAAYLQTQLLIAQKEEAGIKPQAETSIDMGIQTDKALL